MWLCKSFFLSRSLLQNALFCAIRFHRRSPPCGLRSSGNDIEKAPSCWKCYEIEHLASPIDRWENVTISIILHQFYHLRFKSSIFHDFFHNLFLRLLSMNIFSETLWIEKFLAVCRRLWQFHRLIFAKKLKKSPKSNVFAVPRTIVDLSMFAEYSVEDQQRHFR